MKKALVVVLAVVLVFGFSTLAMAEAPENPPEDATEKAVEILRDEDPKIWDAIDDTAQEAKAVNINQAVKEKGFVEDGQELPAAEENLPPEGE